MENREVRLIDANALLEQTEIICGRYEVQWTDNRVMVWIDNAPTIGPESLRPQGKWFECDYVEYDGHSECIHYPKAALGCTNCRNVFKKELLWKRNYCPNCGAKMED